MAFNTQANYATQLDGGQEGIRNVKRVLWKWLIIGDNP